MNSPILDERGYFWWGGEPIPDGNFAPDNGIHGALKIDASGRVALTLDRLLPREGGKTTTLGQALAREEPKGFIAGILQDSGQYVLLYELRHNGSSFKSGNFSTEGYIASICLASNAPIYRVREPLVFSNMDIPLDGFEEWLRLGSIKFKENSGSFKAQYTSPKPVTFKLPNALATLHYDLIAPRGRSRDDQASLREVAFLRYEYKNPETLDSLIRNHFRIEELLVLLSDCENGLKWPSTILEGMQFKTTIYYERIERPKLRPEWHKFWFSFLDLKDDFSEILTNWEGKVESLGPGFYLYLSTRKGLTLYEEHRFISLVTGLEAFHRKIHTPSGASRLTQKIERILADITKPKDRIWLEKELLHRHEPRLNERLFDILKTLPLALNEKRLRTFCDTCASLRNDIAHFGGVRDKGVYEDFIRSLNTIGDALAHLYHARLLQEIGVPDAALLRLFTDSFKSYNLQQTLHSAELLEKSPK